MRRAINESYIALKLVWFRVLCYFLIPAGNTFLTLTETWSGETWAETHPFLKWRLLGSCVLQGVLALVAFIDNSMGKAREVAQEKVNAETEKIKLL